MLCVAQLWLQHRFRNQILNTYFWNQTSQMQTVSTSPEGTRKELFAPRSTVALASKGWTLITEVYEKTLIRHLKKKRFCKCVEFHLTLEPERPAYSVLERAANVLLYFGDIWSPLLFNKHIAKMFFYLYPNAEKVCLKVSIVNKCSKWWFPVNNGLPCPT